jgi:hypothetical protein
MHNFRPAASRSSLCFTERVALCVLLCIGTSVVVLLLLEGRTAHASTRLCMTPQSRIILVRLSCPVASLVRPNTRSEPSPAAALPFGLIRV